MQPINKTNLFLLLTFGVSFTVAGITIKSVAGFGEELGWRSFLVRQFRDMRFIKASLLTGIAWGFWHAPIILMGHNYPQFPVAGVFMMTMWCVLLSPLFLYIISLAIILSLTFINFDSTDNRRKQKRIY